MEYKFPYLAPEALEWAILSDSCFLTSGYGPIDDWEQDGNPINF